MASTPYYFIPEPTFTSPFPRRPRNMPLHNIFRRKSNLSSHTSERNPPNEPPNDTQTKSSRSIFSSSNTLTPSQSINSRAAPPTRRLQDDCPPAYTPSVATHLDDDQFAFLSEFDTVFLIDDSGSMAGRSWRETAQALQLIAPRCTKHDADGIDIYFLNAPDNCEYRNIKSVADVQRVFSSVRPGGGTPTGTRLRKIIDPHLKQLEAHQEVKPLNIIVITDGAASDDPEATIREAASRLDAVKASPSQIGIQFFQVGNESGAAEALRELDDSLVGVRDIVDTVPFNGQGGAGLDAEGILKVVLGAVHRRLDRKMLGGH
jgi:Mg-chelatase subunit ChlD